MRRDAPITVGGCEEDAMLRHHSPDVGGTHGGHIRTAPPCTWRRAGERRSAQIAGSRDCRRKRQPSGGHAQRVCDLRVGACPGAWTMAEPKNST